LVVPEKEEVAGENSERPTASQLVDVVGEDSQIFASDKEPVEIEIEEIEIVEVVVDEGLDFTEGFRKRRKVLIISCMAVGCFLLFLLSLAVSSRISCGKSTRVSSLVPTVRYRRLVPWTVTVPLFKFNLTLPDYHLEIKENFNQRSVVTDSARVVESFEHLKWNWQTTTKA